MFHHTIVVSIVYCLESLLKCTDLIPSVHSMTLSMLSRKSGMISVQLTPLALHACLWAAGEPLTSIIFQTSI